MDWVGWNRLKLPTNGVKKGVQVAAIGGALFLLALLQLLRPDDGPAAALLQSKGCRFPAVFNFGDSNSDTGSVSAAFGKPLRANGRTFFGKPSGRYCDGRLIIDFFAEELGLPYLSAYLDPIGSNFQHGANFAASGSTIQHADSKLYGAGLNPFSLDIQLLQFELFTARAVDLYDQAKSKRSSTETFLPNPDAFSRALYTFDSGQNDVHFALETMTEKQAEASIPNIIDQFSSSIERLYKQGARSFWIHNTGPIGCLPYFVVKYPPKPGNADQNGCVQSYNVVAQAFNNQLKARITRLRNQLQDSTIIYVDIYSAKYTLISNAKDYGFSAPLDYCCGKIGIVGCGKKKMVNGTEVQGSSCSDPERYISWDGIHYSEAANKWVARRIFDGSFSEPKLSIAEACRRTSSPPP